MARSFKCFVGRNAFVGQHEFLGTSQFVLVGLERLCCCSQAGLLRAVECGLAFLEFLASRLKRLVGRDRLVGQHDFLGTSQFVLAGLEGLGCSLQGCLLSAVQRRLRSLKFLARLLKRLLSRDVLVGQHEVLGTAQLVLSGLERLVFFCQGCGLRAIKTGLLSLERLASDFQSLVGRDGLVGQHDLSRPAFFSLSSLEGLGCGLQVDLLHAVKLVLTGGEHLLAFLQSFLVLAVKRALSALERLLSRQQGLLGFDRLVGKGGLLRTIKLRLRGLKVLGCQVLTGSEVLARHAFTGLELTAGQILGRRKLLLTQLQAEFVLLAHVGQARLVDGTHVGQGSVGVCLGVLLRNRRCAVNHGGDTGTG